MQVLAGLLVIVVPELCFSDTIYLKNGRSMKGIVKQQDQVYVEIEIPLGKIKLRKDSIERIESENERDNSLMRQDWEQERILAQQKRNKEIEEEKRLEEFKPRSVNYSRKQGHLIVKAVINGSAEVELMVDTGASFIVLTKGAGERLNIRDDPKSKPNLVQLMMGDGRKVDAKFVLLETVQVEDSLARNVEAAILPEDSSDFQLDGVLGMSFLNNFNFSFDNNEGKLILQKIQ